MSDINVTGVGPNAAPNVYGQTNFAQGEVSLGNTEYSLLILANMITGGTAVPGTLYGPDTPVTLQSNADAISLFVDGSPAALNYSEALAANSVSKIYVMPVPTSAGTAASTTITVVVGSANQTAGLLELTVGTDVVDVYFGSTDSATVIATNVAAAIVGKAHLAATATSAAGVVTITNKVVGGRGNWLRVGAVVKSGTNVSLTGNGVTAGLATGKFFLTGGAGTDIAGYETCIANLVASGKRFYKVVADAGMDSVDGGSVGIIATLYSTLIDYLAQPSFGIRQVLFTGSVDTLAHTQAAVTAINDVRGETISCKNLDVTPGRLASYWAATKALYEIPPLGPDGFNFDNFGATPNTSANWDVPAPQDGSAPSVSDINTAVVSGITILKVMPGGRTKVVKSCTNYFQTNGVFDPRIVDMGKVTTVDYFLDDLTAILNNTFQGWLIADDQPNVIPPKKVCTPSIASRVVQRVIDQYAAQGLIDGTQTSYQCVHNQNPTSRIGISVQLYTADCLHSFTIQINQTN